MFYRGYYDNITAAYYQNGRSLGVIFNREPFEDMLDITLHINILSTVKWEFGYHSPTLGH